ncbi:MAG: anaerobic glycerol-3-phosphate dehydrogenase subunit A [Thermodesulfobacteriota bacterium]|nr:anaerobic glycerol-3-phosphate dehydrogenase subunit A [Thermodesulfobacteriota bacterium]
MKQITTDILVIGGGATGTAVARDCALRGIPCVLVERTDLAAGTTGRNHGLLHSGARYAVKDFESAVECITENRILKKIARHCIEETGGLFVSLPEDDPAYHDALVQACRRADIPCREIDVSTALAMEPNLNPAVTRAVTVPDATIDPFRLASANALDASERGAQILTHTRVTGFIVHQDAIAGARCLDRCTRETFEVRAKVAINASGVWCQELCRMADIELVMFPSKGAMVILDYRINNVVLNRCRKPADGDILVPGDTVSLIGTTSQRISYEAISDLRVTDDEVRTLLKEGERLVPNLSRTRVLRAFCGVRPLVAASPGETHGRNITRGIVLIDHQQRDHVKNFITIAGGKLMTSRLMAEKAVNLACRKLGENRPCRTAATPLPGSEEPVPRGVRALPFSESVAQSTYYRHGKRADDILEESDGGTGLICECEMVTSREVAYALKHLHVKDIVDLRRRTRIGMGPCQGLFCAYRSAGAFIEHRHTDGTDATKMLIDFLEERWKGIRPVLWGDTLREAEFSYWICQGIFGLAKTIASSPGRGEGVCLADEFE